MFFEPNPNLAIHPPLQPLCLLTTIELFTQAGTTDTLDFGNIHRLRTLSYGSEWCMMIYLDSARSQQLAEVMRTMGFNFRVAWTADDPVFKVPANARSFLHAQDLLFSQGIFKQKLPFFEPHLPYAPSATWLVDYLVRLRMAGIVFTPKEYLNELSKVTPV